MIRRLSFVQIFNYISSGAHVFDFHQINYVRNMDKTAENQFFFKASQGQGSLI